MITPRLAPVRPRVRSPETADVVLLEDFLTICPERQDCRIVEIVGRPGSGKTTALAHLAALPIAEKLLLVDDAWPKDVKPDISGRIAVYAARQPLKGANLTCQLAPWGDDDLVEYLLAVHADRCAAVMTRFLADSDRRFLEGVPELYCAAADQLAASTATPDLRAALREAIAERARDSATLRKARFHALAALLGEKQVAEDAARWIAQQGQGVELLRLLRSPWVLLLLAADRVGSVLTEKNWDLAFPKLPMPRNLVAETARVVAQNSQAHERLRGLVDDETPECASMAASILIAVNPAWRPDRGRRYQLPGAYLSGAAWEGVDLSEMNLERADLRRADLRGANLESARLVRAVLAGSKMQKGALAGVVADQANFAGGDLTGADLTRGRFVAASFEGARLDNVRASRADFQAAELQGASLRGAELQECDFRGANLDGANFENADLRGSDGSHVVLRTALLEGANLSECNLVGCDLEYVEWPAARVCRANLTKAWMTGSVLHGADLRDADLREAGLADIDWEDADLRGADLRGCAFHLGSSRSGLVGSPYPCHGSRTGFYTNDYDDQPYKAPEEIRKPIFAARTCAAPAWTAWIFTWWTCVGQNMIPGRPSTFVAATPSFSAGPVELLSYSANSRCERAIRRWRFSLPR